MSTFAKIPANTFQMIQKSAGILLRTFDPENPAFEDSAIIGATTGGFQFSAVPSFVDMGEDIDNCPNGMKELMDFDTWDIKASGTYVSLDAAGIRDMMATADLGATTNGLTKITPRNKLTDTDFTDLWWVGDRGTAEGGFIALHMMNTLNTGGFSLQTEDNGKGKYSFSYACHPSIDEQDTVPFEVYVLEPTTEAAAASETTTTEE